jgi:hypothetical protein
MHGTFAQKAYLMPNAKADPGADDFFGEAVAAHGGFRRGLEEWPGSLQAPSPSRGRADCL